MRMGESQLSDRARSYRSENYMLHDMLGVFRIVLASVPHVATMCHMCQTVCSTYVGVPGVPTCASYAKVCS